VPDAENKPGSKGAGKDEKKEKAEKDARKIVRTPIRPNQLNAGNHNNTPTASVQRNTSSLAITPSFKIRLPRLSNLNVSNSSVAPPTLAHLDSPTRR